MKKAKARAILNQIDDEIILKAWESDNPNWFLDYYVRREGGYLVEPSSRRHEAYLKHWEELGRPESFDAFSAGIAFKVRPKHVGLHKPYFIEDRGYCLLPWQLELWQRREPTRIVIGTPGTGKTSSLGMMAMFVCATTPYYAFLNIAPTDMQSRQMARSIVETIQGTEFERKFVRNIVRRPYFKITFHNEATFESMHVSNNASNIQSWYGDWINIDEAGNHPLNSIDENGDELLAGILTGAATRMRGTRPNGMERDKRLTLISMAYDCETLWRLYDMGQMPEHRGHYWSRTVTWRENPYLSKKDIEFHRRHIPPGQEEQWLEGKRPPPKGAEFSQQMLAGLFDGVDMDPEARVVYNHSGILTEYLVPRKDGHIYVLAGDPGHGIPPYRNAPVCLMFDVTDFPKMPALLVGFWWGEGHGSIMPFIKKMDEWMRMYHVPQEFRGYDSTSSQKAIAELAWMTEDQSVVPLGFEGGKKWRYINSAKVLMSKGVIKSPPIPGLAQQMRSYSLPDKRIAQDIVSAFCMACELMMPLFKDVYPEYEEDNVDNGDVAEAIGRFYRPYANRHPYRIR